MVNKKSALHTAAGGAVVPLGVTGMGQEFMFAAAVPESRTGERECRLLLYKKGEETSEQEFAMEPEPGQGEVHTVRVKLPNPEEYEYNYKINGSIITDPYARLVRGNETYGRVCSETRGAILTETFGWGNALSPRIPLSEVILYKLHVRGFTMNSNSGVKHKGTFAGVAEKIPYLKKLGINTVLLMPCVELLEASGRNLVHGHSAEFLKFYKEHPDAEMTEKRLREEMNEKEVRINYWGYGAKCWYFAPKASYAADSLNPVREMKRMIKQLHENHIQVFLEFVFDLAMPCMLSLDCLRYWAMEYRIDGFQISGSQALYSAAAEDPYLKDRTLIADGWPWGCEPGRRRLAVYQRDFSHHVRRFLKGDGGQAEAFAENMKRNPSGFGTVNYITDQNGFTLYDLYSYEEKHNQENGENNRDGNDYNFGWNCGQEGPAKSRAIQKLRLQMVKNALAALLLAQGTPLIYAGDEYLNSQNGNNNAYCQDNETGWVDWKKTRARQELLEYTRRLIALRKSYAALHNSKELGGADRMRTGRPDISFHGVRAWFPDYAEYSHTLGILLNGSYSGEEEDVYMIFNMHWEAMEFDLPKCAPGRRWHMLLDTSGDGAHEIPEPKECCCVPGRTVVVLTEKADGEERDSDDETKHSVKETDRV